MHYSSRVHLTLKCAEVEAYIIKSLEVFVQPAPEAGTNFKFDLNIGIVKNVKSLQRREWEIDS